MPGHFSSWELGIRVWDILAKNDEKLGGGEAVQQEPIKLNLKQIVAVLSTSGQKSIGICTSIWHAEVYMCMSDGKFTFAHFL